MMPDDDVIPVRLQGGRRAYLFLPRSFSREDAEHVCEWVRLQVDPEIFTTPGNITQPSGAYEIPVFTESQSGQGVGGVADGTRTHDNRNHNPNPESAHSSGPSDPCASPAGE
jgi:hypothetical protein